MPGHFYPISVDSQAKMVPRPQNRFQRTENHKANLIPLPSSHLGDCSMNYLSCYTSSVSLHRLAFPRKPINSLQSSLLKSFMGRLSCPLISSPSINLRQGSLCSLALPLCPPLRLKDSAASACSLYTSQLQGTQVTSHLVTAV